jgi:hypothetical protein
MAGTARETKTTVRTKQVRTGADQNFKGSSEDDPFAASGSKLSEVYMSSTSQTRPRQPGKRLYSSTCEKIAKISEVSDNAGSVRQTVGSPRSGPGTPAGKGCCAARESSTSRAGVKKRGNDGDKADHENTQLQEAATEASDNHCQEMMLLLSPILEQISSPVSVSLELDGKPYKGESVNKKADSPKEACEGDINPGDSELLWYEAQENETLRSIARVLKVPPLKLLELNVETFPSLTLSARLRRETKIIIPESSDCTIVGDATLADKEAGGESAVGGGDVGAEVSKRPMSSPKPSQSSHSREPGKEGMAAAELPVQKPEHMQHSDIKRQERCSGKRPAADWHQLDQSVDPRASKRVSKAPVLLSSTQLQTPERSARSLGKLGHRSFPSSQRQSNNKQEDREGQTRLMEAEGLLRKVEAVIDKGEILSQKSHADPSKVLAGLDRKLVEADIMLQLVPGAHGIETARSLQCLHKKLSIDVVRLKILDFTDCFPNQACSWKSAESWENWKGQVEKAQDAAALAVAVGIFFAQLVDQAIVFQTKKGGSPADIKTSVTRWCKECSSTADLRTIISRVEGVGPSKDIAKPSKELGLVDWKKIRFWFTQQRQQDASRKQSGGGGVAICMSPLSAAAARKQGSEWHSDDSNTAVGRKQRKGASEGNRDDASTAYAPSCASESAQGGGGASNSCAYTCAHTCASQSSEAYPPTTYAPQCTLSAQSAVAGGRCGSRDADASGGLTDAADAANCVKQTLEGAEGRVSEDAAAAVEYCMSPLLQGRCKTPLMPGRISDIDDDCFDAGVGCACPHAENLPGGMRDYSEGETAGLSPQEQDVCHNFAQAQEPQEKDVAQPQEQDIAQPHPSCNTLQVMYLLY